jgi:hypothetical protein
VSLRSIPSPPRTQHPSQPGSHSEAPGIGHNRLPKFRPEDAPRYCEEASNRFLRRLWASRANEVLRDTGDRDAALDAAEHTIRCEIDVGEINRRVGLEHSPPVHITAIPAVRRRLKREAPDQISSVLGDWR